MSETRIRELFSQEAEQLPVGPPPDLASFEAARRSRRRLAAVSVGLASAAAAGVVVAVTLVGGEPGADHAVSPGTPTQTTGDLSLDCRSDLRNVSVWEAPGPYRKTPLALGKLFTNPISNEHAVVESVTGKSAKVVLLRGNGTPWAELGLGYVPHKGWRPGVSESCPGRHARMYWQHQPPP